MTAISLEVIIVSPKKPQNNNKISNSFGACHERDYKVIILFKRLQGWHNINHGAVAGGREHNIIVLLFDQEVTQRKWY